MASRDPTSTARTPGCNRTQQNLQSNQQRAIDLLLLGKGSGEIATELGIDLTT